MTIWKTSDEQSWSMTKKSIEDDGPIGAEFLVKLNFWLNTAERLMTDPIEQVTHGNLSPSNAIRQALEITERELGMMDVFFMGQMLVVIGMYWVHGDRAMRELSPIELKLAGHSLSIKMAEQNFQAATEEDSPEFAPPPAADPDPEADPGPRPPGPLRMAPPTPDGPYKQRLRREPPDDAPDLAQAAP